MVPSSFAPAGDIDFFFFIFTEFIELFNIFFNSIYMCISDFKNLFKPLIFCWSILVVKAIR